MATAISSIPHTLGVFDRELQEVRAALASMTARALKQLHLALDGLALLDAGRLAEIRRTDSAIDEMERRVEDKVIRIITLHAPMADDLRELIAILRIATQLERAGDQAKGIAKRVPSELPDVLRPTLERLVAMGAVACSMLADAAAAYQAQADDAASLRERDARLNILFDTASTELIAHMAADGALAECGTQLLSTAKQIERLGDYAFNIADEVAFMKTGEHLPD